MCVRWYVSPDRVVYLLAGFEDGSVVLWDCRNNTSELTTLKLFTEPGNILGIICITSHYLCTYQLETCVFVNGYLSQPHSQASPVFVLRFAFIHGSRRAVKMGKDWEHLYDVRWTQGGRRGVIPNYKYVRNKPQSGLLYWSTEYSGTAL